MEEKNLHVRIVPMTADHLDEVAELERICFTTPWSRNMLAEELDNYLSAFLVALDDNDKVAGYAGLQAVLDEGYITNVAVRPDCADGLVTLRFRVGNVYKNKKVAVYAGDTCIFSRKRPVLAPGEMETVQLKAQLLLDHPEADHITVTLEEA